VTTPGSPLPAQPEAGSGERLAAAAIVAAALALRCSEIFRYPFDSDEAQHVHVMWGWTQGLLPYRDFFDNHTPLFHLLLAPLLGVLGETPRILFWMRLAMLPLYALTLVLTYRLGAGLLGRRTALWGTVLLAVLPPFFYRTLEFRTDDLWTLLWLAALVLLLDRGAGGGRCFAAGLAVGAAFGVSLKTAPLALGLAIAAPVALLLARGAGPPAWRRAGGLAAAGLAGALVVPLALVAYFAGHGALAAMRYGTIGHNLLATARGWTPAIRLAALATGGSALFGGSRWASRTASPALRRRRLVLVWSVGIYLLALWELWPIVTAQTYLPVEPVVALLIAHAALAGTGDGVRARTPPPRARLPAGLPLAALLALACGLLIAGGPLRRSATEPEVALIADTLRLTGPGDPVMDFKGETIYRRRPFFYVLETITRSAIERGLIPDTIPEAIAGTGTCVAVADDRHMPGRGRSFLRANFISVGNLRVCGQMLAAAAAGAGAGSRFAFAVRLPARYALMTPAGAARGSLDGIAYDEPRRLAAGTHLFVPAPVPASVPGSGPGRREVPAAAAAPAPVALVWAQAIERGFSPFAQDQSAAANRKGRPPA
jgi:hypothetical protein